MRIDVFESLLAWAVAAAVAAAVVAVVVVVVFVVVVVVAGKVAVVHEVVMRARQFRDFWLQLVQRVDVPRHVWRLQRIGKGFLPRLVLRVLGARLYML